MEIKLVISWKGAKGRTATRETFWEGAKALDGPSISADEGERRVYQQFPDRLKEQIGKFISDHPRFRVAPRAELFGEYSGANDLLISVKSHKYGSREVLLSFLAGDAFPLNSADIVQLLSMYAPQALAEALNLPRDASLIVTVGEATGSLRGEDGGIGDRRDQSTRMSRAFYLANFSLIVPVILALGVCFLAYRTMVGQVDAVSEERRTTLSELRRELMELKRSTSADTVTSTSTSTSSPFDGPNGTGTGTVPPAGGPRATDVGTGIRLPPGPTLQTANFKVYSSSTALDFDFGGLAKELITSSAAAGPKVVQEMIKGIGEGIDAGRKGVGLASDTVDLFRKIFPDDKSICIQPTTQPGATNTAGVTVVIQQPPIAQPPIPQPQPPQPPVVLPKGTLLDRRVNFDFDSYELDRETKGELKMLAERLRAEPKAVLIEGHADGAGDAAYNKRLSQRRADAVKKVLMDNDVPENHLHTQGYGVGYFWLPWVPKDAANRRVRVIECTVAGEDRCMSASGDAKSAAAGQRQR